MQRCKKAEDCKILQVPLEEKEEIWKLQTNELDADNSKVLLNKQIFTTEKEALINYRNYHGLT